MIIWLLVGVFVAGYLAIAFEHTIGINKAGSALATGVLCWTIYATSVAGHWSGQPLLSDGDVPTWFRLKVGERETNTVATTATLGPTEIATFPDSGVFPGPPHAASDTHHNLAFEYLLDGQLVHALGEIVISFKLKGTITRPIETNGIGHEKNLKPWQIRLMFWLGLASLIAVPVFKSLTNLPPYMGMLFSLSCIWFVAEVIRRDLDDTTRSSTHVIEILQRIDTSSILFSSESCSPLNVLLPSACWSR